MPKPTTTSASPWPTAAGVDEAIAHYREALEINPDFAASHNNLGILLAGLGQVDEAIPHYRKALEIDPQHAGTARSAGELPRGSGSGPSRR